MEEMLTICIPTYRRAQLLGRCLQKLYETGDPFVKVIVGNNASPDETEDVVQSFLGRPGFSYFRNEENIGGDRNLIRIIERVSTPYFLVLTDDDYLDVRGLRFLQENLRRYPTAAAVLTPLRSFRDGREVHVRGYYRKTALQAPGYWSAFRHAQMAWAWSRLVFRRDCYDLDFAREMAPQNCYFMIILLGRICREKPVLLMTESLVYHTVDNEVFWETIDGDALKRALIIEGNILRAFTAVFNGRNVTDALARLYWRVRITRQYLQRQDGFYAYVARNGPATFGGRVSFLGEQFGYGFTAGIVPLVMGWAELDGLIRRGLRAVRRHLSGRPKLVS